MILEILKNLENTLKISRNKSTAARRRSCRYTLGAGLEGLEDRRVLSGYAAPACGFGDMSQDSMSSGGVMVGPVTNGAEITVTPTNGDDSGGSTGDPALGQGGDVSLDPTIDIISDAPITPESSDPPVISLYA